MDDVTSGFNIGTNISLLPEFNEMLGFTEAEVRGLLESYRDIDVFDHDVEATLALMRGVVRRLPVRARGRERRPQHGHGALLPEPVGAEQARAPTS